VGHSIAGEELSSIGSRHPEKVAGLIYLDAGYAYAYYDRSRGNLQIDANDLRKKLDQLPGSGPLARKPLVRDLLQTNFPQLERDLQEEQKALQTFPNIPPRGAYQESPIRRAIFDSEQRYTEIKCPVLAFYAVPHHFSGLEKEDPVAVAAVLARDLADTSAQSKAFETGIPTAHVVRFPDADHYVFRSNEANVLREMIVFVTKLPESQ
jgi:pimeloyl-ACP methyl ester carboxylesterase